MVGNESNRTRGKRGEKSEGRLGRGLPPFFSKFFSPREFFARALLPGRLE